jgi:hypothetical protein
MLIRILRMLLGLSSVLFALSVVILAVSLGGCTMRLRCRFVMLRRLVVGVFHVVFLMLAGKLRLSTKAASIVAERRVNVVLIEGVTCAAV